MIEMNIDVEKAIEIIKEADLQRRIKEDVFLNWYKAGVNELEENKCHILQK
jgi:hypothetical protein